MFKEDFSSVSEVPRMFRGYQQISGVFLEPLRGFKSTRKSRDASEISGAFQGFSGDPAGIMGALWGSRVVPESFREVLLSIRSISGDPRGFRGCFRRSQGSS